MNVQNASVHVMACVVKCETPPILRWKLCEFQHRKSISDSGINLIVWRGSETFSGIKFGAVATSVRDIDCGDWLARGYMPAHQHHELFYPPAEDLINHLGPKKPSHPIAACTSYFLADSKIS